VKGDRAKAVASVTSRDWAAFDAMTDQDIARQVSENSDAAPLLGEGEDLSKWKRIRGRPRGRRVQARETTVARVPGNHDVDVHRLRAGLGMTQAQFACTYGFSTAAVRSIEQGRRQPSGPARALLMLIEKDPEFVRQTLATAG